MRRDVRRTTKLAKESGIHSFTTHADGSITWVPWHESKPGKPELKGKGTDEKRGTTDAPPSQRTQRSLARATAHRELTHRAQEFRVRCIVRWWSRSSSPPDAGAAPPPPPPPPQLPPPPPPPPAQPTPPQLLPPPPPAGERMDDERAPKRAPSTPTACASPAEPHAKRVPPLPPGPPPPSIPPSPPSASPSPPASTTTPSTTPTTPSTPNEGRPRPGTGVRGLYQAAAPETGLYQAESRRPRRGCSPSGWWECHSCLADWPPHCKIYDKKLQQCR